MDIFGNMIDINRKIIDTPEDNDNTDELLKKTGSLSEFYIVSSASKTKNKNN